MSTLKYYIFILSTFVVMNVSITNPLRSQDIPCPIIFIHGLNSDDGTWTESILHLVNYYGLDNPYLNDRGIFHALLNLSEYSTLLPMDVRTEFSNHPNTLYNGNIYVINFKNWWNPATEELKPRDNSGTVSYSESNESAIVKQGYALGIMIRKVIEATGAEKVILIGHSMGGLAAREYLQRRDSQNISQWWAFPNESDGHRVAKLVTFGTPHLGSNMTDFGAPVGINPNSEAARDLTYNYYTLGAPNFGQNPDHGVYLFGGSETVIPNTNYYNRDVDCDGNENSVVTGINSNTIIRQDNPAMPLPPGIDYTWIVSDIVGINGDFCVRADRQYLDRIGDTLLTDIPHFQQTSATKMIVRGFDEPDTRDLAFSIEVDREYLFFSTFQTNFYPGDSDWFEFQIQHASDLNIDLTSLPTIAQNTTVSLQVYKDGVLSPIATANNNNGQTYIHTQLSNVTEGNYFLKIITTATADSWNQPCRLTVTSSNQINPVQISCVANPSAIIANGSSTASVVARIADQNGNLLSDATNEITFTTISGASSGILIGPNPLNAANGTATISVRSTTFPGVVRVEAASPGLISGTTTLNVYQNPTEVGGTIERDTTWPLSGSPYLVTRDITINSGVILTIEAGTTVLFNRDRDLFIHGALVANGTASAPINFTTSETNPFPRAWGGIKFYDSGLDQISILNHCTISYGGQGDYGNLDSPLVLNGYANPTITNTSMHHNNRNSVDLDDGTYTSDINLNITTLPYTIRRDITMSPGATMTLQPGVIIKMASNSDIDIQGGLRARGTAPLPIIFTSIRDDTRGGDTNGDGVTAGTPGDWGGILFESSAADAACQLDFCEIYYGGQGDYNNQDCPIKLHPYVNPTITNCILANNKLNGVDLRTGGYAADITLDITQLPYTIRGDLDINEGACLTIKPGVTLKFSGNADIYVNGGCLAQGTNSGHIIFTSLRDDAHGGDTNGDGVTSGSKGDWGGIKFNSNVMDSKCHLDNCDIMYAGQGGYGNVGYPIALNAFANPSLTHISLIQNTRNGIDIDSGNYAADIFLNILNIPLMIRGDLVVESSATLTIDPGVILKFDNTCDLYIKGALIASGQPNQQIVFTSLKDDSFGGDTNGDGASAGSKGDWGGIQFYDAVIDQSSILEHCKIIYGGCGGYGNNDSPLVLTGLANPTIKNCILQENTRNGINLLAHEYSTDFYLDIINFPYMVRGDLVVNSPAKMTIQPGVTLKLDGSCDLWINGSLQAVGTPSRPITFTSMKDDSIGGNTNGDGVSVGTPGDWGGVGFRDASDDNLCVMDYVNLFYAGCGGYGNHAAPLTFDNANSKIQRVTITKSKSHGAICYNSASPDIGGGIQGSLGHNKFFDFKGVANKYAFYNDGTAAIFARNNYWQTNDSLQIEKLIFDKMDQNSKGRIYFYPFNRAADDLSPQITVIHPNGGDNWNIGSQQIISWSAVDNEGISKVSLFLSRDNGLTFTEIGSLTANTGVLPWQVAGPHSNRCRIKIQAVDLSENIGFDVSDGNFTIADTSSVQNHPPSTPILLLPITGEEALPDDYLVWTQSSDPDVGDVIQYLLELDNNPDFSSPEIRQSGISGDATTSGNPLAPMIINASANAVYVQLNALQNYINLKDDSTYYWRVQAVDQSAAESGFTTGNSHFGFNKFNTAPQPVVAGFSPKDGLEVRTQKPEISWHPAKDADLSDHPGTLRYSLHLADNTGFANHLPYTTGAGLNTFEVPVPLSENVKWFYRVQTMDDEGLISAWSPAQHFLVNALDEPPAAFALHFPANNSTVTTDSVTFSWANTFDVDPNDKISFTFELSLQQNFAENLISAPNQTDSCLKIGMNSMAKTAYFWRVKATDSDGLVTWGSQSETTPWSFVLAAAAVSDHSAGVPTTFALFQNYPNPFNPETTIRYQLPVPGHIQLKIYNPLGQVIRTLFDSEQPAGFYQLRWDGKDNLGFKVGSGIYICQLRTEQSVAVKKMVVIQ